jgi:GNAT superfamily N-acetyltransferase
MTNALTIREAAPPDTPTVLHFIQALATYERLAHEVTATQAELHDALFGQAAGLHALIGEADGETAAVALYYYTYNTFKMRRNIFLEDLFVEPAHRRSGFGLALLRHLARKAVAEDCRLLEWRVLNWNQPAIDFYERIGARKMETWQTRQLSGDALVALAAPLAAPLAKG